MQIDIRDIPIYYINLDRDIERRKGLEKELTEHGFKSFTRIPGIIDSNKYYVGLAKAYKSIFDMKPSLPFIILEDDARIKSKEFIIDIPDDTDIFYLGLSRHGWENVLSQFTMINENIFKVNNMLNSHAIIYFTKLGSEAYLNSVKNAISIEEHIDVMFTKIQKDYNIYTKKIPTFYQDDIGFWNSKEHSDLEVFYPN